jgi:hypothetical protein
VPPAGAALCRGSDDPPLHRARLAREDQLPAEGAEERVRNRRGPQRPQAAQHPDGAADERVAAEPEDERRVVVVDPEAEPHLLERLLAGRAHVQRPVRPLPGDRAAARELGVEDRVAERSRRVAGQPCGEPERIRTARAHVGDDHGPRIVAGAADE